jgi:Flavodoxin
MPGHKALVVYYSHSGHTDRAAKRVAARIGADIARIIPGREFRWPLGLWRATRMALRAETLAIKPIAPDPTTYDLVLVGTPIWAHHISPPIRSWLAGNKDRLRDYACFYTYGGFGWPEAGEDMARVMGRSPAAVLEISRQDEGRDSFEEKLNSFVRVIGQG